MFGKPGSIFGSQQEKPTLGKQREEFLAERAREEREALLLRSKQRLAVLVADCGAMLGRSNQNMAEEQEDEVIQMLTNMDIEIDPAPKPKEKGPKGSKGETAYQIQEYLQSASRLEHGESLDDLHTEWKFFLLITESFKLIVEWLIAAKPGGHRVLAVVGNGLTELAFKNGKCRRVQTGLVGGNTGKPMTDVTHLLDCILGKNDKLYIIDAIMIEKKYLHDHPIEVRQFFIRSKVQEAQESTQNIASSKLMKIDTLNYVTATRDNISTILNDIPAEERDGLLLVEKSSCYMLGEENPDCIWLRPDIKPDDEQSTIGSLTLQFSLFDRAFVSKDRGYFLKCPEGRLALGEGQTINFSDSCFWKGDFGGSLKLINDKHYRIGIREISKTPSLFCREITSYTVFGYTHHDVMTTTSIKNKLDMILSTVTAEQFISKYAKSQLFEE